MTREIIEGSKAFTLVNVREDADYWLDITVSRLNVKDVPGWKAEFSGYPLSWVPAELSVSYIMQQGVLYG